MASADVRPRVDVELMERSLAFTRGALVGVNDDEADRPTPCARWTVADLLVHMVDSLEVATELSLGRVSVAGPPPSTRRPAPLAGHLRALGCALLEGWVARAHSPRQAPVLLDDGSTRLDVGVAGGVAALEVAVHGWDLARARGMTTAFPPLLAAALLPVAAQVVPVGERDGRFGPPLPPTGGDPSSLLLAHLGRDAGWRGRE